MFTSFLYNLVFLVDVHVVANIRVFDFFMNLLIIFENYSVFDVCFAHWRANYCERLVDVTISTDVAIELDLQ